MTRTSVLIVDDNPNVRDLYSLLLSSAGYEVVEAASGEKALHVLAEQSPDIVLLKIVLPGMNGIEVCRHIKAEPRLAATCVILMSAQGNTSDMQATGLEAGADAYIVRPVTNRELRARVEVVARIAKAADALRRAEAALHESQDFLQTVIETAPTMVVLTDSAGQIRLFNRDCEKVTGYRRDEVLGRTVAEVFQSHGWGLPPDVCTSQGGDVDLLEPHEHVWTTKSGTQRLIEWRYAVLRRPESDQPMILGAGVDISERRRTEQFIAGQNQALRQLAAGRPISEVLSELALTVERDLKDVRCCFLLVDERERCMKIAAAPNLPDASLRSLDKVPMTPNGGSCGSVASSGKQVVASDLAPVMHDAAWLDLTLPPGSCWSQPIISPKGKVLGSLFLYNSELRQPTAADLKLMEDVTHVAQIAIDRRLAEESLKDVHRHLERTLCELETTQHQIVQQERLRALGQMAGGIAHDFNNALSPILGYSEMLLASADLSPKMRNQLTLIYTSACDAAGVVERLKQFYGQPDPCDVTEVVDLAGLLRQIPDLTRAKWHDDALRTGREIDVQLNVENVPPVRGFANELREMLTNFVINAVDAMPNGGHIKLCLRAVDTRAVLEVADSGTGMTDEVRRRCFEPFFTTKGTSGTGLGLSVCHGIIHRHSGRLEVDSALGQGTTFRIELPLSYEHCESSAGDALPDLASRRVLYIDDDPRVRPVVASMLQRLGQHVEVAASGAAGLTMFRADPTDLVLTDLGMPRMDGFEVTRRLKTLNPDLPVILVTGWHRSGETVAGAPGSTPDLILKKPVTLSALREALRRVQVPQRKGPGETVAGWTDPITASERAGE